MEVLENLGGVGGMSGSCLLRSSGDSIGEGSSCCNEIRVSCESAAFEFCRSMFGYIKNDVDRTIGR